MSDPERQRVERAVRQALEANREIQHVAILPILDLPDFLSLAIEGPGFASFVTVSRRAEDAEIADSIHHAAADCREGRMRELPAASDRAAVVVEVRKGADRGLPLSESSELRTILPTGS